MPRHTQLSEELPSFPPPVGGDKPVSFRQILLNTCQDEFEGAENLRQVGGIHRYFGGKRA